MKQYLLTLIVALCASFTVPAQQIPQLVKTSAPSGIKYDQEGKELNGKLILSSNQKDLYVTDGTDQGTQLLRAGIMPLGFSTAGGNVFFAANDSVHGFELWKSDGTTAGTQMVKDISPGSYSSFSPYNMFSDQFIAMGGYIYFVVNDDSLFTGVLWRSDGTTAGTQVVTNANGKVRTSAFYHNWATICNNKLYFAGVDSIHGAELWETDGTAAGTHFDVDVLPGIYGSGPVGFFTYNNHICFNARDSGVYENYMYISDATPAGTYEITSGIDPDVVMATDYTVWHDTLLFITAHPKMLWRTDGTVAGTSQVMALNQGVNIPALASPYCATLFNDQLYFMADSVGGVLRRGIWRMENARAVPSLIFSSIGNAGHMKLAGNALYFKFSDSLGAHLWRMNGTTAAMKIELPNVTTYPNTVIQYYTASQFIRLGLVHLLGNRIYYTMLYDTTKGIEFYTIDMFATSVPEVNTAAEVKIYPNPAHTAITLTGVMANDVSVYNMNGMLVKQKQLKGKPQEIEVNDLAPGIYLLHIFTADNRRFTERFVKY